MFLMKNIHLFMQVHTSLDGVQLHHSCPLLTNGIPIPFTPPAFHDAENNTYTPKFVPNLYKKTVPLHQDADRATLGPSGGARRPPSPPKPCARHPVSAAQDVRVKGSLPIRSDAHRVPAVLGCDGAVGRCPGDRDVVRVAAVEHLAPVLRRAGEQGG